MGLIGAPIITKLEAYLIGAVVVVAIAAASWLYVAELKHERDIALADKARAEVQATVAAGQTAATQFGAQTADARAQSDARAASLHQDNAHAIQASPGAAVRLDPVLNRAGRIGLCRYEAYRDDPGCVGLLGGGPAKLPQAGQGHAAPAG